MSKQNENPEEQDQQLSIELPAEVAEGVYSNLAVITHSNQEFVMDFIRIMPNMPQAKVKARIILTPGHAKRLQQALQDNLNKFEQMHGSIEVGHAGALPFNFGGPMGEA